VAAVRDIHQEERFLRVPIKACMTGRPEGTNDKTLSEILGKLSHFLGKSRMDTVIDAGFPD